MSRVNSRRRGEVPLPLQTKVDTPQFENGQTARIEAGPDKPTILGGVQC